jgi:hypothetical protein
LGFTDHTLKRIKPVVPMMRSSQSEIASLGGWQSLETRTEADGGSDRRGQQVILNSLRLALGTNRTRSLARVRCDCGIRGQIAPYDTIQSLVSGHYQLLGKG